MNKRKFGVLMALCNGLSWGLIMPSFSLFLESLGASLALIGVIAASRTLPQFFLRLPFAAISDRLQKGKKPFLMLSLFGQILSPFFLALTTNAYHVLGIFLIEGVAEAAFWPSIFAHMAELGTRKRSGEAMGALTFGWGSGFTIGTAMVGVVLSMWGFIGTYLTAASVGSLALPFLLLSFEKVEKASELPNVPIKVFESPIKSFKILVRNPNVLFPVFTGVLDASLMSAIQTFLPLYAHRGGLNEIQIGGLFTVNSLVSTIVRYPVGRLSDNVNRKGMLIIGTGISSFVILLLPFTANFYKLMFLLAMAGFGSGIGLPTRLALMLDTAPHQKALATAMSTSFIQMAQSISPAILGVIGSQKGLNISFFSVSSFSLIVLVIVTILTEKMSQKKRARSKSITSRIIEM